MFPEGVFRVSQFSLQSRNGFSSKFLDERLVRRPPLSETPVGFLPNCTVSSLGALGRRPARLCLRLDAQQPLGGSQEPSSELRKEGHRTTGLRLL